LAIKKSIFILRRYKNVFYLLESYETQIRILIAQDAITDALRAYGEAFELAKTCGEEWLNNYINKIGKLFDSLPPKWFLQ
jgi:hypothetical protein